ncbi:hypothetical protein JDV02_008647 [Purpureocillium takamizusanense]|uniref:Mitochondrial genome maintenance protein MGM101 n=1 Tax=Purpureocillium takamizusanense TaxID=2060973 RepID=A0A9Q8VEY3_9HYPO|nr:uncharacterized protein JDV02_008647 [Purpureocillium takamizusanense]UNI22791.1 hypothetical protein JDV02_008647 [Purpureocillium takamizusanense]
MLLPRRIAAAARPPRQLSRRARLTIGSSPLGNNRTCRPYATEAASTATQPATQQEDVAVEPPTPPQAKTQPAATTKSSKFAKPGIAAKSAPAAATDSFTSAAGRRKMALPPPHIQYEAKTIAHSMDENADAAASQKDANGAPLINWANSFHGVSFKPVSEEQFKVLMQPLDERDIEVKPDGIIYLPEIKYRRRLNEAFGPMGWGMIPKEAPVVGDSVVTREYALVADGRFVSQAQGENGFFSPEQLPSAVEGCKSNALMRCCKDLGIGSELWDPHFIRWFRKTRMEEVWVEHQVTKKKRTLWYRKGEVEVAYPYKRTR